MAYDAEKHFTTDELEILERLFAQQRLFGGFTVQHAAGLSVVARLDITIKPPLPRWVKLLAAGPPESLGIRQP